MNWTSREPGSPYAKDQTHRGKLSEDDLVVVAGQRSQLTACLHDRYGLEKQDAEDRVERCVQELQH